jgi:ferredoxin
MKVHIDHARCETNALCVGMAPDLFELDGDYRSRCHTSFPALSIEFADGD